MIHEECLQEELCVCQNAASICGDEAAKICFPDAFIDDNGSHLSKSTKGMY